MNCGPPLECQKFLSLLLLKEKKAEVKIFNSKLLYSFKSQVSSKSLSTTSWSFSSFSLSKTCGEYVVNSLLLQNPLTLFSIRTVALKWITFFNLDRTLFWRVFYWENNHKRIGFQTLGTVSNRTGTETNMRWEQTAKHPEAWKALPGVMWLILNIMITLHSNKVMVQWLDRDIKCLISQPQPS